MLRICDIARLCGCFLVNLIVNAIVDSDICVAVARISGKRPRGSVPKIRHLRLFFPKTISSDTYVLGRLNKTVDYLGIKCINIVVRVINVFELFLGENLTFL